MKTLKLSLDTGNSMQIDLDLGLNVVNHDLPIWFSADPVAETTERLDNNYFSPAGRFALAELQRLESRGEIELHAVEDMIGEEDGLIRGVKTAEEGEIPVLEGKNLRPNCIIPLCEKWTDQEGGPGFATGDLLIGKDGEPGMVAVVTQTFLDKRGALGLENMTLSTHVYRVRLGVKYQYHSYFLSAFLNSRLGQAILRMYISGGTTPTLRTDELKNLPVPIPTEKNYPLSEKAKETIEALQINLIDFMANLEPSVAALRGLGAQLPLDRLPMNYVGGGKSDPHGYYRDRK